MLRGICEPARLLDIVENFTSLPKTRAGLHKLVAKNHQYLGVNNAFDVHSRISSENQGKLGVFWHTQGSGKSYSMIFFAQKVLRKLPGNWTFVIVTDRNDLDDQIYKNFASVGAVTEPEERVRAQSGEHLQAAAAGRSPLCLHPDPEIPHRAGRGLPDAVRALGYHRDDR